MEIIAYLKANNNDKHFPLYSDNRWEIIDKDVFKSLRLLESFSNVRKLWDSTDNTYYILYEKYPEIAKRMLECIKIFKLK